MVCRKGRAETEGESDKSTIDGATPGRTPRSRLFAIAPVHTWRRDVPVTRLIVMNGHLQSLKDASYVQSQPLFMARPPTCPFLISLSHLKFRPPASEFDAGVGAVSLPKASIDSTSNQGRKGGIVKERLGTLLCLESAHFANTRRHVLSPSDLPIPVTRSPFIRLPAVPTRLDPLLLQVCKRMAPEDGQIVNSVPFASGGFLVV